MAKKREAMPAKARAVKARAVKAQGRKRVSALQALPPGKLRDELQGFILRAFLDLSHVAAKLYVLVVTATPAAREEGVAELRGEIEDFLNHTLADSVARLSMAAGLPGTRQV